MSNWKDFFYFQKSDRVAILLLSILICVGIILSFVLFQINEPASSYIAGNEQIQKQFAEFEGEMKDISAETDTAGFDSDNIPKSNKNTKSKLSEGQVIDLNSASVDKLLQLPGIGQTLAVRIAEYRMQLGGFVNLEQLQEVKGITVSRFSNILPYLILKEKHKPIKINKDSEESLLSHPYLDRRHVEAILIVRKSRNINSVEELDATGQFTARDIARLQPYISFD